MRKPVTDIQRDIGNRLFLKGILLQLAGGGEEFLRRRALRMADDIADIALFLASDKSGYLTGQTINANGGMYFG